MKRPPEDFVFDERTAKVFDDMLDRSIPFYYEIQQLVSKVATYFVRQNTRVYDVGCSTGTTLVRMLKTIEDPTVSFVGIDSSPEMLEVARRKLSDMHDNRKVSLLRVDLNSPGFEISDASFVVMNWTLQFVRPLSREALIRKISDGLIENGAFVLCEKVVVEPSRLNRMYIDVHHQFKRRHGYTDLEIAQKREALENVLIPYRVDENVALLEKCGLHGVDLLFRWCNWAGFIALKS